MENIAPPPIRYYADLGPESVPKAFYTSDIYPPQENGERNTAIPLRAIEINEAEWKKLLQNPGAAYRNGEIILPPPAPPQPETRNAFDELDVVAPETARANSRLDAGVTAAVDAAGDVQAKLRAMPPHSDPPTVEELQAQIDYLATETLRLSDSYVAMLKAQDEVSP